MRKTLSVFAALGVLGAATLAFAAGAKISTTTGRIKSVDMSKHTVTLENGSTYKIARGVNIRYMKAGEKVTLTFTSSAFTNPSPTVEASAIAPAAD